MRRNMSNNELQNESGNNSHLLDPEDFVMSNTSMSMHTSMVQGAETERANILKDSHVTLLEDSTVVQDNDDARVSITKQNHDIINRQLGSNTNKLNDDTPLMRRELDDEERQKYRSQKSGSKDFSMCFDNLQVDSK